MTAKERERSTTTTSSLGERIFDEDVKEMGSAVTGEREETSASFREKGSEVEERETERETRISSEG